MKLTKRRGPLYFLSGVIAALPTVFSPLWFFSFFSFIPLLLLLLHELLSPTLPRRMRAYYGVGLAFSMGYFIPVFHWFAYLYPLDFVTGMTPPVALAIILLACIGLPLLQSLGFALLFLLLAPLSRTKAVRRLPVLLAPLFAAGWVLFAYTQTLTWAGVPWGAQLALSQTSFLPFLATASLLGSYFVSFLIALINALLALALLALAGKRRRAAQACALLAAGVFLLNLGAGLLTYLIPRPEREPMRVAVLQGNLGSSDKWQLGTDAIAIYDRLATEAAAEGATLMVWPETAVTSDFSEGSVARGRVRLIAEKTGAIQIVGAFSWERQKDGTVNRYNSLFLVYPDGRVSEQIYSKRHLVPFGEYVPMEALIRTLFPPLAELEMLADGSSLRPGEGPQLFQEEAFTLGGLVCFDTIYESLARESTAAGAELLVIGTNDSWFFDSAAVDMHNRQAVLRAVENRRYVLRAANTGISSIISPRGEQLATLGALVEGQATADAALVSSGTLYTAIGDVFLIPCLLFFLSPLLLALSERLWRARNEKAADEIQKE